MAKRGSRQDIPTPEAGLTIMLGVFCDSPGGKDPAISVKQDTRGIFWGQHTLDNTPSIYVSSTGHFLGGGVRLLAAYSVLCVFGMYV